MSREAAIKAIGDFFESLPPDPSLTEEQRNKISELIADIQQTIDEKSKGQMPLEAGAIPKLANMIAKAIGIQETIDPIAQAKEHETLNIHSMVKTYKWSVSFPSLYGTSRLLFVNSSGQWTVYHIAPPVMRGQS